MTAAKQVVYVDVDDEITAIVEKIKGADARVIALVLPKRASVFQSIVNMKLLKRQAEQANKHLVLITSEAGLMPLAGAAGVYVAPTLQSKPAVPAAPVGGDQLEDSDEAVSLGDDFNSAKNATMPIGALAAGAAAAGALPEDVEELDEAVPVKANKGTKASPEMAAAAASGAAASKAKPAKDKSLSVPNFFRFRKRIAFAVLGLFALIGLWYVAWFVMPTASVTIKTRTADIDTSLDLTLDTDATKIDTEELILPAKIQQQQKNNTQQAPATGQENRGEKATGSIELSMSDCNQKSVTIPAGTGLSSNGMTFITQASANLSSIEIGGKCRNADFPNISAATIDVVAQKAGASYNLAASTFTGAPSGVAAKSSEAMAGGTDKIIKIVQQADIDAAKAKMSSAAEKNSVKSELQKALEDNGLYAIQATFHTAAGELTTNVKAGDEAEAVTVSETTTYTMYGVKKADLRKQIEKNAEDEIDKSKQSIIDDGIDDAKFTVPTPGSDSKLKISMDATAVAGPQLDVELIKQDIAGKKSGVVKDEIKANPGVEDVTVKYSPFWVTKAPKPEKTTIVFEKTGQGDTSDKSTEKDANE